MSRETDDTMLAIGDAVMTAVHSLATEAKLRVPGYAGQLPHTIDIALVGRFACLVGTGQAPMLEGASRALNAIWPVVTACLFDEGQGRWRQRPACDGNDRNRADNFRVCHEAMADPWMDG